MAYKSNGFSCSSALGLIKEHDRSVLDPMPKLEISRVSSGRSF